ncbi:MAG: hypothetical protein V5A68_05575 [Candidatus Thermoplasmatota archaeon]
MSGYQNFVEVFGEGVFVKSSEIKKNYSFQKALSSLYIIPTFFKGIYYIPTFRERKGHFFENKQDFFTFLFNFRYGRKNWYWGLSTAARYYGLEWSATHILEIVTMERTKTIRVSERISSLQDKKSYRSMTLAKYYDSLDVNTIYIHKGDRKNFESVIIDDVLGPVCNKDQLFRDVKSYRSKVRDQRLRRIYDRILEEF